MVDPYVVLQLPSDADEATVRQRYLELVRQFPPDRAPERFVEIREAYESLRDPVRRLEQRLFDIDTRDSLDEIISDVRARLRDERIPVETLLSLAEQR
jgi:curved DNA-binding protein CbpA